MKIKLILIITISLIGFTIVNYYLSDPYCKVRIGCNRCERQSLGDKAFQCTTMYCEVVPPSRCIEYFPGKEYAMLQISLAIHMSLKEIEESILLPTLKILKDNPLDDRD